MTRKSKKSKDNTVIIVAIIGAVATIATALIAGIMREQPIPSSVPRPPLIIDSLDSTLGWNMYTNNKSSTIMIDSVPGKTNNGIEVSYTIEQGEWVGIFREINPGLLLGTDAIRFSYKGSGVPNTIELKLLLKIDDEGHSAIFSVLRNRSSNVRGWTIVEASYAEFVCWVGTGCSTAEKMDLSKVWKIDIAVSSKPGDTLGTGTVIFDDLQAITY